jgi:uncharacterized membrane protein
MNSHMEEAVRSVALHLSLLVEALAALVIGVAIVQLFVRYIPTRLNKDHHLSTATLRVKFGSSLTLALELLLAADILQTAVAPTWDDIGKLAAIAAIRTILNYFLEKELRDIGKRETNREGQPVSS